MKLRNKNSPSPSLSPKGRGIFMPSYLIIIIEEL